MVPKDKVQEDTKAIIKIFSQETLKEIKTTSQLSSSFFIHAFI